MQNCFLMPSRLKSHIILVLDRLQYVAWVNCLVMLITLEHVPSQHWSVIILTPIPPVIALCSVVWHLKRFTPKKRTPRTQSSGYSRSSWKDAARCNITARSDSPGTGYPPRQQLPSNEVINQSTTYTWWHLCPQKLPANKRSISRLADQYWMRQSFTCKAVTIERQ